MSFDWYDYFLHAEECQSKAAIFASTEAALRSAISRAYYSVFCRARNVANVHGAQIPQDGRAHTEVPTHFKRRQTSDEKQLGRNLERLRRKRNMADYDDVIQGNIAKEAQAAVAMARDAHALMSRFK